ncbi:MAG: PQQ-binding-like beta-propeller repeat protein, partial [Methanotrichaceae archaeon]|nr:PQQ-binding-like beta-propeller repeat protein [Methanotrichaceae archaeon]
MKRSRTIGPRGMVAVVFFTLATTLLVLSLVTQASTDFVTFHGDDQRTGNTSGEGPDEPNLLWSTSLTGHGYIGGEAAISEGLVFVSNWPDMTFKGDLGFACLDEADGELLWLNPLGGKGGASTPAISEDKIFVGSLTGDIYCLNASTGVTVWNKTLDRNPKWWGVASSPLVQDGMVYVMSFSDGALHALTLEGEELWNLTTGEVQPFSSAASSGQRLYFPGGDPAMYCVDASSGGLIWKTPTDGKITATPALWKDLAISVTEKSIVAFNAISGQEVWKAKINGTMSSPAIAFGRVYVGSDDKPKGHLSCFDARNGSLIWKTEVNGPVKSSPLILDGKVYFGTSADDGAFYCLNASNGSVVWTYPVNAYIMSSAAAFGGKIFIGADDGCLYAFGSRPRGLIWEGEVQLTDEQLNITATSGKSYQVKETTALGALVKVALDAGIDFRVNDSLYEIYGLTIESLGGYQSAGGEAWRFWINYPDESTPTSGPDLLDLVDGDRVVFFYGDRRARPEDSPRLEITPRLLLPVSYTHL